MIFLLQNKERMKKEIRNVRKNKIENFNKMSKYKLIFFFLILFKNERIGGNKKGEKEK